MTLGPKNIIRVTQAKFPKCALAKVYCTQAQREDYYDSFWSTGRTVTGSGNVRTLDARRH